jgi:hypothetical protein
MTPSQDDRRIDAPWRTPCAVALAVGIGIPVGLFVHATAVPFGPVLIGWISAFAAAVVVPAGLCFLATNRYSLVGLGFAAGVALAVVVASLATTGVGHKWTDSLAQFAIVFVIISFPAVLSSGVCALLKWEDKRAREKNSGQ